MYRYFSILGIIFVLSVYRDEAPACAGNILHFLFLLILTKMLYTSECSVNIFSVELNKISKIEVNNGRINLERIRGDTNELF